MGLPNPSLNKIDSIVFALHARGVQDGSITEASLAEGAVTTASLSDMAVTRGKLATRAVDNRILAPGTAGANIDNATVQTWIS